MTLKDVMDKVQTEMQRAAILHGEKFKNMSEAKEAIDEEYREVWEAIEEGDYKHAEVEMIQLIGVLVKLMRSGIYDA